MFQLSPADLIALLNAWPPELLMLAEALLAFAAVIALAATFGESGLVAWVVLAILGANLQVLKPVAMAAYPDPVALGTILFASTYLATDLLAEHHGPAAARRAVWIGFAAYLCWTVLGIVTLGYRPLTAAEAGADLAWALPVHGALAVLLTPAPALFVAGMTAYVASQLADIWLFERLRRATSGRHLWLRNNASTMLSALIDNTVFSLLAWIVLAPEPLALQTVIVTYILGTWILRVLVALADTPAIYLARLVLAARPGALAPA